MLITWVCEQCGKRLARLAANPKDPRLAALTEQAGEDIIRVDQAGNMTISLLCDECLDALHAEEESEIVFLRGPELH